MVEIDAVSSTNDTNEGTSISSPQLRAIDAINPESELMAVTRLTGVTTAAVAPGGQVINGQGAVISLGGGTIAECLVLSPSALYLDFGEAARTGEEKRPQTRMGVMGVLREEFTAAREYAAKWDRHRVELARWEQKVAKYNEEMAAADAASAAGTESDPAAADAESDENDPDEPEDPGLAPTPPSTDLAKEVLAAALRGDLLVVARAHRLDDVESAIRFRDEFGLRLAIVGAANAWKMADRLAAAGVPVLISATENPDSMETQGARYTTAARLNAAGVQLAIIPEDSAHNVRNLPYEAGIAVTYGLPHDAALRAITTAPAQIFGLGDRVGQIAAGQLANLVVVEGDPLQPTSHVRHVFVAGREMPLASRQTDLAHPYRERYLGK
jgi:imidazolonepropionase-like amidohydrolase